MLKRNVFCTGAVAVAIIAALGGNAPARADKAVVVGINDYPDLGSKLEGCVNDANSVAAALHDNYHFTVTTVTDAAASKEGILDALDHVAQTIKPNERFVFYFAGHGEEGTNGNAHLLTATSSLNSEENDITADVLNQKIKAIHARSRTVLLDSCFSGGMMRSVKGLRSHPDLVTRGFVRPDRRTDSGESKDLALVNFGDTNQNFGTGNSICYFTATRGNEQAGEDVFDGAHHGVFTYFLVPKLTGERDLWQTINDAVEPEVSDHMDDMQHPTLSPSYDNVVAFDVKAATPSAETNVTPTDNTDTNQGPKTMWDLYNVDHVDHGKVSLTMFPNKTTISVGDQISFHVANGRSGYLVVLERGTSGKVNLIYPLDGKVESAQVTGDNTTDFPGNGQAFKADDAGTERIKAILFDDRSQAQELLQKFAGSRGLDRDEMRSRDLELVSTTPTLEFYTSDINFEVVQ